MRSPRSSLLSPLPVLLAACGGDPAPRPDAAAVAAAAATPSAAQPASARVAFDFAPVAARLLAGSESAADRERASAAPRDAVAALLDAAASADDATRGRAPAAIMKLGTAALPALATGLGHRQVAVRRLSALTLLQWSEALRAEGAAPAIVGALATARADTDPAVRAAAEHAYLRATGDTRAIDQSRADHEAALRTSR